MFTSIHTFLEARTDVDRRAILALRRPQTAKQLAKRLNICPTECAALLEGLSESGLVRCLNTFARASRVYFPTTIGRFFHNALAAHARQPELPPLPRLDWTLYGSICFSHRRTVLKTLTRPMSTGTIRRTARFNNSQLRMNTNNVRDVCRYFESAGIVERVYVKKKPYPLYQVTSKGRRFQRLLLEAEAVA